MPNHDTGLMPVFGVSDFVAVFNQTLETAYPSVTIVGELANYRVSKNRWVYFDLKDELASVKFFGTIYQLPGSLEDGLLLQVRGVPRLHPQFGFSLTIQNIQPVGEGSLRRAAALLEAKLKAEGLFEASRKRPLPYPPNRIGLIASGESAAFADFIKIINQRWVGLNIEHADVQVQGESAPAQIIRAIEHFNQIAQPPEVLVITRGGGSAEDLAAFNNEQLTRTIAASRIPTLVAIGHEVDISLAELAADRRASTPSNAAELLVPDKGREAERLNTLNQSMGLSLSNYIQDGRKATKQYVSQLNQIIVQQLKTQKLFLYSKSELLAALSPTSTLNRGYSITRDAATGAVIKSAGAVTIKQSLQIQFKDGKILANVTKSGSKKV